MNRTLMSLSLASNHIGDKGAQKLGEVSRGVNRRNLLGQCGVVRVRCSKMEREVNEVVKSLGK